VNKNELTANQGSTYS